MYMYVHVCFCVNDLTYMYMYMTTCTARTMQCGYVVRAVHNYMYSVYYIIYTRTQCFPQDKY